MTRRPCASYPTYKLPSTIVQSTILRFAREAANRPRIQVNTMTFQNLSNSCCATGPKPTPVMVLMIPISSSPAMPSSHQPNPGATRGTCFRARIIPAIVVPAATSENRMPRSASGMPHQVSVGSVWYTIM